MRTPTPIDGGPKHLPPPNRPKGLFRWKKYALELERYVDYLGDREWHRICDIDEAHQYIGPLAREIVTRLAPIADAWDKVGHRFPWEPCNNEESDDADDND